MQTTINQRVKFLLEKSNLSARAFGKAIGVGENTTQNYLEPRLAQPRADYLEKIVLHFASISADWLLTGRGEAFISESPVIIQPQQNNQKNNKGNIVGNITGGNPTFNTLADCVKENEHLRTQVALLTSQLADKQEIIDLLKGKQPSP